MLGPHQGRELALLMAGTKPLALISPPEDAVPYLAAAAAGRLAVGALPQAVPYRATGWRRWFGRADWRTQSMRAFAPPDQAWRIPALLAIYRAGGPRSDFDHATIGWLLGYEDEDIADFLSAIQAARIRARLSRWGWRAVYTGGAAFVAIRAAGLF